MKSKIPYRLSTTAKWAYVRRWPKRTGRFLRLLIHRFAQDGAICNSASLTYTTLLSLVPLMTVMLAVFSAFPVFDRVSTEIQDFMFDNLVPASGDVIREHLEEFSQKASRLTGTGTVFLLIVAVMMVGSIDQALNTIWQVKSKRGLIGKFMVYWALLSLGPVLIGCSVILTSYIVSMPFFTDTAESLGVGRASLLGLMPVLASAAAFTLLYVVVPQRVVPLRHALAGGMLAAVLFELAKQGFALYVTTFPTYQAIYGALAAVPVFLIWIYLSWLVTLLGAEFTYCLGIYRDDWNPERADGSDGFLFAYRVLGYLWEAQHSGNALTTRRLMQRESQYSQSDFERLLLQLESARLVLRTERDEWALARDLGEVSLLDLYRSGAFVLPSPKEAAGGPDLALVFEEVETCLLRTLDLPLSTLYEADLKFS